jgi:hypothetical protein
VEPFDFGISESYFLLAIVGGAQADAISRDNAIEIMVRFWIRWEIFEFGVIPFPTPSDSLCPFGYESLQKVIARIHLKQEQKGSAPLLRSKLPQLDPPHTTTGVSNGKR